MEIASLAVDNRLERTLTVDLQLAEDDEVVFTRSVDAVAARPEENRFGGAVIEDYPTEPGRYVIEAALADVPEDEPARSNLASVGAQLGVSCLHVECDVTMVGERGAEHPSVSVTYSSDCEAGTGSPQGD